MPPLIWSPRSQRDLRRLYDFLSRNSLPAAQRAMKAIQQGAKHVESQPATGHLLDDKSSEYREWIVPFGGSAYVMRYRFDEYQIVILAIRHGREAGY